MKFNSLFQPNLSSGLLRGPKILTRKVCIKPEINNLDKKTIWGPFKPIPNVKEFKVEIEGYDPLFLKHGLLKRLEPKFIYEKYHNARYNRYIEHQLLRMRFASHSDYGKRAIYLMMYSNTFFIMALAHCFPKGHRDLPMSKVVALKLSVHKLASMEKPDLKSRRLYIEKANGKLRPLGIPRPGYRIGLHMLNQLLVNWLQIHGRFHDNQHAYQPHKGTLSAWREILGNVINHDDIYEFDLQGFFDRVSVEGIIYKLKEGGLPKNMQDYFESFNCQIVKLPKLVKLEEIEVYKRQMIEEDKKKKELKGFRGLQYVYGIPQGAATSPTLATLLLNHTLFAIKNVNTLMYADDGVFFGNLPENIFDENGNLKQTKEMKIEGINFNHEKSGGVKKAGKGLKPLKFLGLEFDGETLRANTRPSVKKGETIATKSTLVFDKWDLVNDYFKRTEAKRNKKVSPGRRKNEGSHRWKKFVESDIMGYIQSRLYNGEGNMKQMNQDFSLSYEKKSVMAKYIKKMPVQITVFNSTTHASDKMIRGLHFNRRLYKVHIPPRSKGPIK